MRDVVDMLQGAAGEQQLCSIDLPVDADAEVWADPDRVRQILLNLVMNAVKYATTPDALVVLSVSTTPQAIARLAKDLPSHSEEHQILRRFAP